MIEKLIENEQFEEALSKLEGKFDDISLYHKLVCLFGLKRYDEAYHLSKDSLTSVEKNYYDILSLHIAILLELEKDDEAYDLLEEELEMPYIPSQYENYLNETYEMLYRKRLQNQKSYNVFDTYSDQEIKDILIQERDKNLILIILDQLQKRNIRLYLKELKYLLTLKNYSNDLKAIILELLVEQGIMEEVKLVSNDREFDVDLTTLTPLMEQVSIEDILKIIEEKIDEKDVSIFNACQDLLIAYHASIYPMSIEEDEYLLVAAGIYYAALTNFGIDKEIDEICELFGVKAKFIEAYYENICKLSTF